MGTKDGEWQSNKCVVIFSSNHSGQPVVSQGQNSLVWLMFSEKTVKTKLTFPHTLTFILITWYIQVVVLHTLLKHRLHVHHMLHCKNRPQWNNWTGPTLHYHVSFWSVGTTTCSNVSDTGSRPCPGQWQSEWGWQSLLMMWLRWIGQSPVPSCLDHWAGYKVVRHWWEMEVWIHPQILS